MLDPNPNQGAGWSNYPDRGGADEVKATVTANDPPPSGTPTAAEFLSAVVPWPVSDEDAGYVNLHYSWPNTDADEKKRRARPTLWSGWPYKDVIRFQRGVSWCLQHPERAPAVYYCLSLQAKKRLDPKHKRDRAAKLAADAISLKAIWIDCDVRPDDASGKHYTDFAAALKALLGFVKKHNLPSPTIVNSGGGFHVYWISDKALTPQEWYPYANGLKALLIQDGVVVNPSNADHRFIVAEELPETARKLGVTFPVLEATTVEELDIAFASAAAQHADAIVPLGSELTVHVTRVPRWRRSIVCPRSTSSDCSPPMAVWFHTASI
jgi:hypothetical protein